MKTLLSFIQPIVKKVNAHPISAAGLEQLLLKFSNNSECPLYESQLDNQLIRIRIHTDHIDSTPILMEYDLLFAPHVQVFHQYDAEPNLSLHVSAALLQSLPKMEHAELPLTQWIKQNQLDIQGKLSLAHAFLQWLQACQPDLAEQLSPYLGDVMAHEVSQALQQCHQRASQCVTQASLHFQRWQKR